MSYTNVTVTGTALEGDGNAVIPNAVITFDLDQGMLNGGLEASGIQTIASTDGTFTIIVKATDDTGTTAVTGGTPLYHVSIVNPETGERVEDFRCPVPHATTPTTLDALKALAK